MQEQSAEKTSSGNGWLSSSSVEKTKSHYYQTKTKKANIMLEGITGSIAHTNCPFVHYSPGMLLLLQHGQFGAMHFREDVDPLERVQGQRRSGKRDLHGRDERTGWFRPKIR